MLNNDRGASSGAAVDTTGYITAVKNDDNPTRSRDFDNKHSEDRGTSGITAQSPLKITRTTFGYSPTTILWVPKVPQHRSYIIDSFGIEPGSFTITQEDYSAPIESQNNSIDLLTSDKTNKITYYPEPSINPNQSKKENPIGEVRSASNSIKYKLTISIESFDRLIHQEDSAIFVVSSKIIKRASSIEALPTQKQTEYFAEKILFCQKLDALRYNVKVSLEHQNARKNLEEFFLELLQDPTVKIDINNFNRWAKAVGLPHEQFTQLCSSDSNNGSMATIQNATLDVKLQIFKWLLSIRRTVDGRVLDAEETKYSSRSSESGRWPSEFFRHLPLRFLLLRNLWQWRIRGTLNPHQELLEQIGGSFIFLALVVPMLNAAIHLSSNAIPSKLATLIFGLMNWPHTYLNGPVCLALAGVFALLLSHFSNQREEDRIGLRYYRLKENLLHQTRTDLSNLNLEMQALSPTEYGWTPQGAEKLTEILGIKEQVKSVDAVFKHWLLDKESIVFEYEQKKQATASKVRNLLLGAGAAYVTIEVGQYIQDYRDVLQKKDMKSYLAELRSPSTNDAVLMEYVKSDVSSYSEVIFAFFLVLILVVIKTFFLPSKDSAN